MDKILGILGSLGVNETFFWMAAFFIVSYLVVSTIALKPLSKILIAREKRTEGRVEEIYSKSDELKDSQNTFNEKMKAAQTQGSALMNKIKQEAQDEQRNILQEARNDAQEQVALVRVDVKKQFDQEMIKVQDDIPTIVEEIMGCVGLAKKKLTKKPVQASTQLRRG